MWTTARRPWSNSTRRARLPADWSTRRRRVLARDAYACRCEGCTACAYGPVGRCQRPATDVDHRIPGDDHRDANLRSQCAQCHAVKSGGEGARAANAARAQRGLIRARPPEAHPGLR